MPPDDFYSAIESDGAAVAEFGTRPGLALIAGGLPLIADGQVAGAIGVAGAMTGAATGGSRRSRSRRARRHRNSVVCQHAGGAGQRAQHDVTDSEIHESQEQPDGHEPNGRSDEDESAVAL